MFLFDAVIVLSGVLASVVMMAEDLIFDDLRGLVVSAYSLKRHGSMSTLIETQTVAVSVIAATPIF